MEPKTRVIDRAIATDSDGKTIVAGVGWFPSSGVDRKIYDSCLTGDSRPLKGDRATAKHDELTRVAKEVIRRDRAIFRGLG